MEASLSSTFHSEIRIFRIFALLLLALLLGYNLFATEPPLSNSEKLVYVGLTLALAAIHCLHLLVPAGSETLKRVVEMMALNATLVFGIALLLHEQAILYFYLIAFDGYAGLRFISKGYRWPIGYVIGVTALSGLIYTRFGLLSSWWNTLPIFALAAFIAEFFIHQWEQREKMDTVLATLALANQQLQDYTAQAESLAISKERNRLAHEIHDTLGHTLTTLDVQLGLLAHLPKEMDEARRKAVENAQKLVSTGLTDVRRAVKALRPEVLETFSLPEAIAELARNFRETTQIAVNCQFVGDEHPTPSRLALPIYRTAQEALTNVRRHARDTQGVSIEFRYYSGWVELQAINEPPKKDQPRAKAVEDLETLIERGNGLRGMRERAINLGGEFQAEPTHSGGFQVSIKLPIDTR